MTKDFSLAPIVFLLGTSTAGKSTICKEITNQSKGTTLEGQIEIWGHDSEIDKQYTDLGPEMFGDDPRFSEMVEKGYRVYDVLSAIWGEPFKDRKTGKSLPISIKFEQSLPSFLLETQGYDEKSLRDLREMAREEKETGRPLREAAKIIDDNEQITKLAINRAIENSKKGISTVLDGIPLGFMEEDLSKDNQIMQKLEDYLKSKDFNGPTQVALVHLHPKEMAARLEQRNIKARAPGGDIDELRDNMGSFGQYSQLFGRMIEDGAPLGELSEKIYQKDIYEATEKFGSVELLGSDEDKVKIKIRNLDQEIDEVATPEEQLKAKFKPVLATITEGRKILDAIGFEDGATSLKVNTKVKADVVFDHQTQASTEIAEKIFKFISDNSRAPDLEVPIAPRLEMPKAKEYEDLAPSKKPWVERMSNRARSRDDSAVR